MVWVLRRFIERLGRCGKTAGDTRRPPHDRLFWRYAVGKDAYGYAVRTGQLKLVYSAYKGKALLFDLTQDPYEQRNLAATRPDLVRQLTADYRVWSSGMRSPRWLDPHGANVRKEEARRQAAIDQASRGER